MVNSIVAFPEGLRGALVTSVKVTPSGYVTVVARWYFLPLWPERCTLTYKVFISFSQARTPSSMKPSKSWTGVGVVFAGIVGDGSGATVGATTAGEQDADIKVPAISANSARLTIFVSLEIYLNLSIVATVQWLFY